MKTLSSIISLLSISIALLGGCANANRGNKAESSPSVSQQTDGDSVQTNSSSETNKKYVGMVRKGFIDVTDYLDAADLQELRKMVVRAYENDDYEYYYNTMEDDIYDIKMYQDVDLSVIQMTEEDNIAEMRMFYKLLTKIYPSYKPVSEELYRKRLREVFGFTEQTDFRYDEDVQILHDPLYTVYATAIIENFKYTLRSAEVKDGKFFISDYYDSPKVRYTFYHEGRCVMPSIPFAYRTRYMAFDLIEDESRGYCWRWEGKDLYMDSEHKLFDSPQEILTYRKPIYERCMKEGRVWIDEVFMETLYYYNKYVFYGDRPSLTWLMLNNEYDVRYLLDLFNYDKDTTINNFICKKIRQKEWFTDGKCFYSTNLCPGWVTRKNFIKSMAECSCDTSIKDKYGLVDCSLLAYMRDKVKFIEDDEEYEDHHIDSSFTFETEVYVAYYLYYAYDLWVERTGAAPGCWMDYYGPSLYNKEKDCESLFYQHLKRDKFYGLDDFAERSKEIYEHVRAVFKYHPDNE